MLAYNGLTFAYKMQFSLFGFFLSEVSMLPNTESKIFHVLYSYSQLRYFIKIKRLHDVV